MFRNTTRTDFSSKKINNFSKNAVSSRTFKSTRKIVLPPLEAQPRLSIISALHPINHPKPQKVIESLPLSSMSSQITAQAYSLQNYDLQVIQSKQNTKKRPIASLTKLMTLYVGMNLCRAFKIKKEETFVRVSVHAGNMRGTHADLSPKQWISLKDLFYGLMLPSGNDAAVVIAQNLGAFLFYQKKGQADTLSKIKSIDITPDTFNVKFYLQYFIKEMNLTAQQLQMNSTHFSNPHGLDDQQNYSTATDLSSLLKAIYSDSDCFEIISTKSYVGHSRMIPDKQAQFREIQWTNTHRLIDNKAILGGKTGQTFLAGNCLSSIIKHKDKIYFIIVLGCMSKQGRFRDTKNLLIKLKEE